MQESKFVEKVYLYKYCLSEGIVEVAGEIVNEKYLKYGDCGWATEFSLDRAEAVAKAEEMRLKKIKSLEKSIAKFKNMSFK